MLNKIFDLFAAQPDQAEANAQLDAEQMRVATCVLLLAVAGADNEFAPSECEQILDALKKRFELNQEDAEELLKVSQDSMEDSVDVWKFTNRINASCTNPEKIQIIEEIWRVIYADGAVDGHEDYMVHKLARLMNLTHPQLIDAKLKVRDEIQG